MKTSLLTQCFPHLETGLIDEIEAHASLKTFAPQEHVIKQGQYIRFLPLVLSGDVKVYSDEVSLQFLLYFVSSGETCIYSFAHIFNPEPAEFAAVAESESQILLLPLHQVKQWLQSYPSFANMVLKDYQKHYQDLLHTTKQLICYNLEERLLAYLKTKTQMERSNLLKITHQQIANDLGSSREVISRLLKKLSANEKVVQIGRKIKVL